jgi:hypothetical protein
MAISNIPDEYPAVVLFQGLVIFGGYGKLKNMARRRRIGVNRDGVGQQGCMASRSYLYRQCDFTLRDRLIRQTQNRADRQTALRHPALSL